MRNLFHSGPWALLVLAVLSLSGSSRGAGSLSSNYSEAAPSLAGSCVYSLDPTGRVHDYAAEFATFNITAPAGCDWTAVNTNDWMAIKLYTNGTGSGILRYSVFANENPVPRTGSLTVNGEPFAITQLAAPCAFSILPTNYLFGSASAAGGVTVFTADGCDWSASNTNLWISISPTNGTGGGVVSYVIAPNYGVGYRTGVVSVAGRRFLATQLGTSCKYSLTPANKIITGFGAATGTVSVTTTTGCHWSVGTSNDWIAITPPTNVIGSRSVLYSVAANPGSLARTGALVIADRLFPISQGGAPCTYSVTPASRSHGAAVESNVISVTAPLGCPWMARTTNSWITLTSNTNGPGSGTLSYQLGLNTGPARTALVFVGTARFTVTQGQAVPPVITSLPVSQRVLAGAPVVFDATASGTQPLNFRWQFKGSNLVDGPTASGSTTPRLTLPGAQSWQAGNYSVIVSNLRGQVTSAPPAVLTVNTAPVLAPIGNKTATAGASLAFRALAADADVPAQILIYTLDTGSPAGASIDPATGNFTWTPAGAQGGRSHPVTIRVTDNGLPVATVSEAITITVLESNTAPVLKPIGNKAITRGKLLSFTASASDGDVPAQTLNYSLNAAPAGATIGSTSGVFSWTPLAAPASGTNQATIRVSDNGSPPLSAFETIAILVSEPGSLALLPGTTNGVSGAQVSVPILVNGFTNLSAIQFSLHWDAGVAAFAGVEQLGLTRLAFGTDQTNDGILTVSWRDTGGVSQTLADGMPLFAARFQLIGAPGPASRIWIDGAPTPMEAVDANLHLVPIATLPGQLIRDSANANAVVPPDGTNGPPPRASISMDSRGAVSLQWNTSPGATYRLQYTIRLSMNAWTNLGGDIVATGSTASATDAPGAFQQRFYRVVRLNN